MAHVHIYTTPFCPFCTRAKQLLERKDVPYAETDVSGDREKREAMRQRANGRNTVPQIFIGETHVGGCDELFALENAGKLDALLNA